MLMEKKISWKKLLLISVTMSRQTDGLVLLLSLSPCKNWARNLICKLIALPASDKYRVPAF